MKDQTLNFDWHKISNGQIMRATLLVVAIIGLFAFAFRFYNVILIFLTAVILGIALKPIVDGFHKLGMPRWAGIVLIYLLIFLGFIGTIWYGAPLLIAQSEPLTRTITESYHNVLEGIQNQDNRIVNRIVSQFPQELTENSNETAVAPPDADPGADMLTTGMDNIARLFKTLFWILATFILSFYWILEKDEVKRRLLFVAPAARREMIQTLWAEIEMKVGRFVLGQTILCFSIFLSSLVAYLIIGLPNALLLALFAGVMEAVPNIGPVLGAVPALLIAFTISPTTALYVIIATLIIQQLENAILFPRIMDQAVGVRPFVSLLALLGFGTLFGVVGAILSIPFAAIIQIFMDYFLINHPTNDRDQIEGRNQASILQYEANELIQDVRQQIRRKKDEATATNDHIEDSIESITSDLSLVLKNLNLDGGADQ